jgi:hypothetical protein
MADERVRRKSPRDTIRLELQQRSWLDEREQETIPLLIVPPWRQGSRFYIEDNTEKAQKEYQRLQEHKTDTIHVYTDGSDINDHIGATAVYMTTNETRGTYMGAETTSTVYAGELRRIILAVQLAGTY